MSLHPILWDDDNKAIRGSFVNGFITLFYIVLIILGAIFSRVASNLAQMAAFLIGFFAVSFGVWAGKKVIENIQNVSTATDAVTSTLSKLGIKVKRKEEEK